MKILYFTNKPAPYRVEFFNQLNIENDVTVIFDYVKNDYRNKKWYDDNKFNFNYINLKKNGYKQLKNILKQHYDVVIIGTYATKNAAIFNLMLRKRKIDFYINADGGFIAKNEKFYSKFLKKFFISKATYYLSSGKETNKYLEYYGAKKDNIYIYPLASMKNEDMLNNVISKKEKVKLRKKHDYNYEKVYISIGSFIKRKGYDLFFEYIKDNIQENECFIIIGGGELKDEYEENIRNNELNNIFLIDFLNKEEIFEYYKMADAFFFPSREDIWGLVINEAMAFGLPIISSDRVIAATELIDKEFLFDCYNKKDFLEKLKNLRKMNSNELSEIGNTNLNKIKKYSIEESAIKHIEIFKKNINNRKCVKYDE